jgi:Flp pilus assembly pilin Flp
MTKTGVVFLKLRRIAQALRNDCNGQDLIEYSLITGFVACAAITLVPQISDSINTVMSKVNSVMIQAAAS